MFLLAISETTVGLITLLESSSWAEYNHVTSDWSIPGVPKKVLRLITIDLFCFCNSDFDISFFSLG